jgi:hypothetical protein
MAIRKTRRILGRSRSTCSDLQNVLDNRTAVINSSINLFDRVNGRTTVSATLQDPGNGFCRNIYRSFRVFVGNDAVQRAGLTISGGKLAKVNIIILQAKNLMLALFLL